MADLTTTTVVPGVAESSPITKLTLSSLLQLNAKLLADRIRVVKNGFWTPKCKFREIKLGRIVGYDFVQINKSPDPRTASG